MLMPLLVPSKDEVPVHITHTCWPLKFLILSVTAACARA